MNFRKIFLLLITLLCFAALPLAEARGLQENYDLVQVLVLSRHNIRAPLVDNGTLSGITPHQWHDFGVPSVELTVHGGQLEESMGAYARSCLQQEGLLPAGCQRGEGEILFYANAIQRTLGTARHFADGMFPGEKMPVKYEGQVGEPDPLFWGDLSGHSAAFDRELKKELAALGGSEALTRRVSPGIEAAAIALDNPAVENDELQVTVKEGLHLGGSIRPLMTACDALSLQYYELGDSRASFGHELSFRQWQDIAAVKEAGIHVYRRMPTFARALARPLLEVFLQELNAPGRKFTFLCGHDTNVATVMGALGVRENSLPESIEQEVPIGGKLVVERWQDRAGESFLALKLVYPSVYQLCSELPIDMRHPPQSLPLHLQGMEPNEEDLIPLQAFRQRLTEAIESDEELMDVDGK